MIQQYSIDQIKSIMATGFLYDFPTHTTKCIQQLIVDIGINPRVITTSSAHTSASASASAHSSAQQGKVRPPFNHGQNQQQGRGKQQPKPSSRHQHHHQAESWKSDKQVVFQPTVFEETTKKVDKITETLRLLLNKLSDKTYDKIQSDVCALLEENNEDINEQYAIEISKIIFDLASSNRFYSQSFADLYAVLMERFHYIRTSLDISIQSFVGLFDDIVCVDANTNYEMYCDCNKANERRRALAAFFVSLTKIGVIHPQQIVQFLSKLLRKFHEYISVVNKKNETNEICEVVSILYDKSFAYAKYTEEDFLIDGRTVDVYMTTIAKSKVSSYKSLTSKSIFKFMDLLGM